APGRGRPPSACPRRYRSCATAPRRAGRRPRRNTGLRRAPSIRSDELAARTPSRQPGWCRGRPRDRGRPRRRERPPAPAGPSKWQRMSGPSVNHSGDVRLPYRPELRPVNAVIGVEGYEISREREVSRTRGAYARREVGEQARARGRAVADPELEAVHAVVRREEEPAVHRRELLRVGAQRAGSNLGNFTGTAARAVARP